MLEIIILHQIVNAEKVIKTLVRIELSLEGIKIVQVMGLPIEKGYGKYRSDLLNP